MNDYIAIIPIRSGSKGVKNKNIKPFYNNLSMTDITIKSALESNLFSSIIVTSDDESYLDKVKSYNIVTHKRPAHLGTDEAKSTDVVLDVIKSHRLDSKSWIVLLQVTSPLRSVEDIRNIIAFNENSKNNEPLISFCEKQEPTCWAYKYDGSNFKRAYMEVEIENRRQDNKTYYKPNGCFYLIKIETFLKHKKFYLDTLKGYVMDRETSIDVDDEFDWKIAQFLYSQSKS
tara:strand:- start:2458 stop:3147 length:690 start_codon:yes stop_codon:yes gene_type:complete